MSLLHPAASAFKENYECLPLVFTEAAACGGKMMIAR